MNWKRCLALVAIGASCLVPATSFADAPLPGRASTVESFTIKAGVQSLSVIRQAFADGTPRAATDSARPIEMSSDDVAHYSALASLCLDRAPGGARVDGPVAPPGDGDVVVMSGPSTGSNSNGWWIVFERNGQFHYYFFAYDGHGQHIWGNSRNGEVWGEENW